MKNNDIKHSMDDITKDKIVLVDAKGNTLGEVERTRDNDKSEEISKKTSQKKKKQSKKKQSKQKQSKQKQLKQEQSKQNDLIILQLKEELLKKKNVKEEEGQLLL